MAFKPLARTGATYEDEIRVQFENKGDSVEGYYMGAEKFTANGEEYTKHRVRDTDGNIHSFLGSYILNSDLPQVPVGTLVKITLKGMEKSAKGRKFKAFDIQVDEEKTLKNVAPLNSAAIA